MIVGFIVTAGTAGHFLDPFSTTRLLVIATVICGVAFLLTLIAVWGVETSAGVEAAAKPEAAKVPFMQALSRGLGRCHGPALRCLHLRVHAGL